MPGAFGEGEIGDIHRPQAAQVCIMDMSLGILRSNRRSFIVGVAIFPATPALHSWRQLIIFFHARDPVEEMVRRRCDQRCSHAFQLHLTHSASLEKVVSRSRLRLNSSVGIRREQIHRHIVVPHHIQPFSQVFPVFHRKLN